MAKRINTHLISGKKKKRKKDNSYKARKIGKSKLEKQKLYRKAKQHKQKRKEEE